MAFGDFSTLCSKGSFPACNFFAGTITQTCKTNTISVGSANITNLGDMIVTIVSILVLFYLTIKSHNKAAAVGRREISIFFMSVLIAFVFVLVGYCFTFSNDKLNKWLLILNVATSSAAFWALLFFGFVGMILFFSLSPPHSFSLPIIPDGSPMSIFHLDCEIRKSNSFSSGLFNIVYLPSGCRYSVSDLPSDDSEQIPSSSQAVGLAVLINVVRWPLAALFIVLERNDMY
ncbi:Chitin synthase export chaperone [Smittium culicis]|uniref:Chitin synthase export chaperone n=1 Tax=Smittium culicis TaxID=133412 RepID=A0A1R1YTR8_9FUNG|nr:Chitin synthase export chaperone [Smittium culicis]